MKTKRRAWVVAGVVVVLVACLVIPFGGDIWLALAYEDGHSLREFDLRSKEPMTPVAFVSRPAKKLRWYWLPGPLYVFDEVCYRCLHDAHEQCLGEHSRMMDLQNFIETRFNEYYTCLCPDPSHKDKP